MRPAGGERIIVDFFYARPVGHVVEALHHCLAPHRADPRRGISLLLSAAAPTELVRLCPPVCKTYFNRVPFRSIVPDTSRYPCFSQFAADSAAPDGDDGDRIPSMMRARVQDDLDRIVATAHELIDGTVSYERCLDDHFADLLDAHDDDPSALWSFDDVHLDHFPEPWAPGSRQAHARSTHPRQVWR
ncbi:MAG TPA: hypothetical protein VN213_17275 [Solirubrobacteraceae bacterium]|nr:hypothetical protein [Solirubrobacteraceae bacterium]